MENFLSILHQNSNKIYRCYNEIAYVYHKTYMKEGLFINLKI